MCTCRRAPSHARETGSTLSTPCPSAGGGHPRPRQEAAHLFPGQSTHPRGAPGAGADVAPGRAGMKMQAWRWPEEPVPPASPRVNKQPVPRVFNFLRRRPAARLLSRELLKASGSNSRVFYRRGEIIECFQRAPYGRESSIFTAWRILHSPSFVLRHRPPLYFLEAESRSAFSCGFSLMKHSGLRSKHGLKVNQSPCHEADK